MFPFSEAERLITRRASIASNRPHTQLIHTSRCLEPNEPVFLGLLNILGMLHYLLLITDFSVLCTVRGYLPSWSFQSNLVLAVHTSVYVGYSSKQTTRNQFEVSSHAVFCFSMSSSENCNALACSRFSCRVPTFSSTLL